MHNHATLPENYAPGALDSLTGRDLADRTPAGDRPIKLRIRQSASGSPPGTRGIDLFNRPLNRNV